MSDDIKEEAKARGVDPGTWTEVPEGDRMPPLVKQQAEALLKLKGLLEGAAGRDRAKVAELKEKLIRIKHGGGV